MIRTSLNRTLRRCYMLLAVVLLLSLLTKLAEHIPGLAGTPLDKLAKDVYEYLKDMALVFVTVVAAYLANVFQKRQQFISALREEWREIVATKSALYSFTQTEQPAAAHYLEAFCAISETIDNMRTVYRNVGETETDIGLYPFAPLHDMRRALQTLEPGKNPNAGPAERKLARDAILQSFYALRESFLDELDPDEPDRPLLIINGRRVMKPGATIGARGWQDRQRRDYDKGAPANAEITAFLTALYEKENATAKPWREAR